MRATGEPCAAAPADALSLPRWSGDFGGTRVPPNAFRRINHKACIPARARRAIMDSA